MDAAGLPGSSVAAGSPRDAGATGPSRPQAGPPGLLAGPSLEPFGHAVGFLLSQLGYAVTRRFRSELEELSLEPRHFGLMRGIAAAGSTSQQSLGDFLHIPASSIVALLDHLEARGLVRRRLDASGRRVRFVELTDDGRRVLARAVEVAVGIEAALCAGFDAAEREAMIGRLQKLAANLGLTLGVHPGGSEDAGGPEGTAEAVPGRCSP